MRQAISSQTKSPIFAGTGEADAVCPDCLSPVYFRQRFGWVDHYCHKPNSVCHTKLVVSRESLEHEIGKKLLLHRLTQTFPDLQITTEQWLQDKCRIADVSAIQEGKIVAVYECQISPILIRGKDGLEQRSRDYLDTGIPVTWWFGERSLTATVRHWCEQFFGDGAWEVIENSQVRLEGYLPNIKLSKKTMSDFFSNAVIDCIGLDKVDELLRGELQKAIEQGDAASALKISTTWNELKKNEAQKERAGLLESDEYWINVWNQVIYILWITKIPQEEVAISRKAIELFDFDEKLWSKTTLTYGDEQESKQLVSCWNWIVGYSLCLDYLIKEGLVECEESFDIESQREVVYALTPDGTKAAQEILGKLDSLPLKKAQSNIKSFPLPLPLLPASVEERKSAISREYTEKFTIQVLTLFSTKSMTRRELYEEAENRYSFTEEDKELIGEGKNPFPRWKEAYSRNVDNLLRNNCLEYRDTDSEAKKKNKPYRITETGLDKLRHLLDSKDGELLLATAS